MGPAISLTPQMLAMETGCLPPELLVTVSIIAGIFAGPWFSTMATMAMSELCLL